MDNISRGVEEVPHELLRAWLAVPESMTAEIIAGELVTMPRPAPRHAVAQLELGTALSRKRTRGPGGWIILPEPAVSFCAELFVPDIAGWRRERMPEVPERARIELAPDWVCGILSPSTQGVDRDRKMHTYANFGVAHVWLVDPAVHFLEVYRLSDGRWLRLGVWSDADIVRAEPFEDLDIELAPLWDSA